jgi:RNA polymerase sigma factor (TIGR02999 family)
MEGTAAKRITRLLADWRRGDEAAAERLLPLVYHELKKIAAIHLRGERAAHTLQPTALVHEAYLRLVGLEQVDWRDRAHFFALASRLMRRVLVDHARRRQAVKRSPDQEPPPHAASEEAGLRIEELLALDAALDRLAALDERQVRVVELRYFAGLSVEETAQVLDVSPSSVKRDWVSARAWLHHQLSSGEDRPSGL